MGRGTPGLRSRALLPPLGRGTPKGWRGKLQRTEADGFSRCNFPLPRLRRYFPQRKRGFVVAASLPQSRERVMSPHGSAHADGQTRARVAPNDDAAGASTVGGASRQGPGGVSLSAATPGWALYSRL